MVDQLAVGSGELAVRVCACVCVWGGGWTEPGRRAHSGDVKIEHARLPET